MSAATTPRQNDFAGQIRNMLTELPGITLPTLVVVPFAISDTERQSLMKLEEVAGCLLVGEKSECLDERCGTLSRDGEWGFPGSDSRSVTYLGWSKAIRPLRLYQALRRKMFWIIALDLFGRWRRQSIPLWYLSYLKGRWQQGRLVSLRARDRLPFVMRNRGWMLAAEKGFRNIRPDPDGALEAGRILLVTGSLCAGGAERQVATTAVSLARSGHEVEVLSMYSGVPATEFYRELVESHVTIRTLTDFPSLLSRTADSQLKPHLDRLQQVDCRALLKLFPATLREEIVMMAASFMLLKPSVVHLWQDHTNLVGGVAALLAGAPRIILAGRNVAPHHFEYHRHYMRSVYRFLLRFPEVQMINNSAAGARSYAEWLSLPETRIGVVRNAVDTGFFKWSVEDVAALRNKWGVPDGSPLVGGVFRFSPEKDPLLWLDSIAIVSQKLPKARFVLLGEGEMQTKIEQRLCELGLSDRVRVAGLVRDMGNAMAAFDVLLLTSKNEGLPNVLIEAQLAGCPVVTTDVGGTAETLVPGVTGWVVSRREKQLLADAVCRTLVDKDWRERACALGQKNAKDNFSVERLLSDTLVVYARKNEDEP